MRNTNKPSVRGLGLVLLTLGSIILLPQIVRPALASTAWGSPTAIETNAGINILNAGLQASNGTMWLAWQTNRYRGDSQYDIAYKTYTNGIWSSAHRLTTSGVNSGAALAQLSDGTIALFWAYKPAASYLLYYETYNVAGVWSSPNQVTTTTLNDTSPSAAVGPDGTLWLVWTRTNSSCTGSCTDVWKQIYYKTLKAGVWSSEARISTDNTKQSISAAVTVAKDNVARVVYSKGLGSLENYQIYYRTNSGTGWSAETQIVTSTSSLEHPAIMQDRNGTMWVFWQKKFYYTGLLFQYQIWGQYSYNSGTTWVGQAQLTNAVNTVDSMNAYAVQSTYNKSIWLFYTTDPNVNDDLYALVSSSISPIHDVTITAITPSTQFAWYGGMPAGLNEMVSFTVTVLNRGDQSEIVTVSLTINNSTTFNLGTKQNLATPGGTVNLVFNWNSTKGNLGLYSASASVSPVPGETVPNQADNSRAASGLVRVLPWGDIDQDGIVNLNDVSVFFFDYGFGPAGTACPSNHCLHFPVEDINNEGIVDIIDVGIAARNYGVIS